MIASLGMYDRAETAGANDRFWARIRDGLRARGITAPDSLTRGEAAYWPAWQAPDLVLSQTCSLPYRARLHDRVTLIGTFDHGVEGCPPGYYRSVLIARADDRRSTIEAFDSAPLAFNDALSQSGWAAPQTHFRTLGLSLTPAVQTGGHRLSAQAVLDGAADLASIDAVTWSVMAEHDLWTAGLKIVDRTKPTPGLPLIAARGADRAAIQQAVSDAIGALSAEDRHILRLKSLIDLPPERYLSLPIPTAQEPTIRPA